MGSQALQTKEQCSRVCDKYQSDRWGNRGKPSAPNADTCVLAATFPAHRDLDEVGKNS